MSQIINKINLEMIQRKLYVEITENLSEINDLFR